MMHEDAVDALSKLQPIVDRNGDADSNRPFERAESGAPAGESPELLRWRADMLLDEMLLAGVDIAFIRGQNGQLPQGHFPQNAATSDGGRRREAAPAGEAVRNGAGQAGVDEAASLTMPALQRPEFAHEDRRPASAEQGGYGGSMPGLPASSLPSGRIYVTPRTTGAVYGVIGGATFDRPNPDSRPPAEARPLLVSAEQRYAQLSRTAAPSVPQPLEPTSRQSGQLTSPYQRQSLESRSATAPEPLSNMPDNEEGEPLPALGPVRRTVAAAAMTTALRSNKYSTLLPRESASDPKTLQREIAALQEEVIQIIPAGHEAGERVRLLLEKAHTILQSDTLRSAEVDYYLNQVRAMLERMRQTFSYSHLYQQRLTTYLGLWLTLCALAIIGCAFYGGSLIALFAWFGANVPQAWWLQHIAALLITLFAGALGGTLCTFVGMRRQRQREHGFFDRKFGLRGLILPIVGLLVGVAFYLVVGAAYWWLAQDPAQNLWLALIPALPAFLLAFSQEMLFGVRT